MSAIFGIVGAPEVPVRLEVLRRMLKAIGHRGPHAQSIWHRKNVGLGHALLHVTEEADASMPLIGPDIALTADARLDSRHELSDTLGLKGAPPSDPVLIAAAYRRWGEQCPEHLTGDFAFAIWDFSRQILFCARDHFGIKPFYYYYDSKGFLFGSEIKAILIDRDLPIGINEEVVADFLVPLVSDSAGTIFKGVLRLPPHHRLVVSHTGVRASSFWELHAGSIALPNRNALPEEFLEIFTTAVRSRTENTRNVGAMLSGGLDSSSIACVASSIRGSQSPRIPTISLNLGGMPEWSERDFLDAVLAGGHFDPSLVAIESYAPFDNLDWRLQVQDGLFFSPGPIGQHVYDGAAENGIRVLLDGHGGDEVVSHGFGRLYELANSNRWLTLWREVQSVGDICHQPAFPIFLRYLRRYGLGGKLTRTLRVAFRPLQTTIQTVSAPSWRQFISSSLLSRTNVEERYRSERSLDVQALRSEQMQHERVLSSPLQPLLLETLDRSAAAAGVEARYPFWDKRLVEFCLNLPPEEKLKGGWSRLILRRAMEGILPPSVQWRRDKLDFSPHLARGMLVHHRGLLNEIFVREIDAISEYVDVAAIRAAYARLIQLQDRAASSDVHAVWRAVVLAKWLRRVDGRSDRGATLV